MNKQDRAISLLRDNYENVGIVFEQHIDDENLYVVERDTEIVGAAVVELLHDVTMVQQIAVRELYRHSGIGSELIAQIAEDSTHSHLEAKVHKEIDANLFYDTTGWENTRETGDGLMNVWRIPIEEAQSDTQH